MSFYTDLAKTAAALLKGKGQQVTIVRAGAEVITPKWAVDIQEPTAEAGSEVNRSDRKVIMEVGTEPLLTDCLVIGTTVCAIISVKPVAPAGEPVIYILQARAGG